MFRGRHNAEKHGAVGTGTHEHPWLVAEGASHHSQMRHHAWPRWGAQQRQPKDAGRCTRQCSARAPPSQCRSWLQHAHAQSHRRLLVCSACLPSRRLLQRGMERGPRPHLVLQRPSHVRVWARLRVHVAGAHGPTPGCGAMHLSLETKASPAAQRAPPSHRRPGGCGDSTLRGPGPSEHMASRRAACSTAVLCLLVWGSPDPCRRQCIMEPTGVLGSPQRSRARPGQTRMTLVGRKDLKEKGWTREARARC